MLENRVSHAVTDALQSRPRKQSNTGFCNICCVMCVSRGESQDRRFRCGIIYSGDTIGVSCFNCRFKSRFTPGFPLSGNFRSFLESLGVSPREVKLLGYWAEQVRAMLASSPELQRQLHTSLLFPRAQLPPNAESLEQWADMQCADANFLGTVAYLLSRGDVVVAASKYYWTPETKHNLHRRLIVPCHQQGELVGWVARSITPTVVPRYHNDVPTNLLFNVDRLTMPSRKYAFIVEGVFDALAIEGVAAMGASLNEQQITWINQCDKQVIVVPDRDRAGCGLINIAIEQGWHVATPHYGKHQWWDADIKDADAAVQRYGKLYTLRSIVESSTADVGLIRQRTSYML